MFGIPILFDDTGHVVDSVVFYSNWKTTTKRTIIKEPGSDTVKFEIPCFFRFAGAVDVLIYKGNTLQALITKRIYFDSKLSLDHIVRNYKSLLQCEADCYYDIDSEHPAKHEIDQYWDSDRYIYTVSPSFIVAGRFIANTNYFKNHVFAYHFDKQVEAVNLDKKIMEELGIDGDAPNNDDDSAENEEDDDVFEIKDESEKEEHEVVEID